MPPHEDFEEDKLIIDGTVSGNYTVKDMYNAMADVNANQNIDPKWMKIWKLNVSLRVRSFVWMLKHNKLLTNFNKGRRGLGSAMCSLCGYVCEDTIHVFRDYTKAMQICSHVVLSDITNQFFQLDISRLVTLNINANLGNEINWNYYWAMGVISFEIGAIERSMLKTLNNRMCRQILFTKKPKIMNKQQR